MTRFDSNMQYLLCNSDTTIHIARLMLSGHSLRSSTTSLRTFDRFGLVLESFSIRYSNPDHSASMVAVFGSEPDTVFVITSKGLFQKLSIDGDIGISKYREDSL